MESHTIGYKHVANEHEHELLTGSCRTRLDDVGAWNICKAWYLFLLHMATAAALTIACLRLDGHEFQVGSAPTTLSIPDPLYQTQVTALVSVGVLIVRLICGAATNLLIWRTIYILMDKRGVKIGELTDLVTWRKPIFPAKANLTSVAWSIWAVIIVILLWPSNLVSPLVNSSISWIPSSRILTTVKNAQIADMTSKANWLAMLYPDARMFVVGSAAAMSPRDPAYAYSKSSLPLRRYFNATIPIPDGSDIDLPMPYFAMDLEYIDADPSAGSIYWNAGSSTYQDVNPEFSIRWFGTVAFVNAAEWTWTAPNSTQVTNSEHLLGIKLRTVNFGDIMDDGTIADNKTLCPSSLHNFESLPQVTQLQVPIINGDKETVAYDCYMFAKARVVAGAYDASSCRVTTTTGNTQCFATCYLDRNDSLIQPHWLTEYALNFTSQAVKYAIMLNSTQPWVTRDFNDYVVGTMTLGFQSAWSGLMTFLGDSVAQEVDFRPAQNVVQASIDKTRLYAWLGVQGSLLVAALLVWTGGTFSKVKTVRDTTLALLTINMNDVVHDPRARGLCSAVALSDQDRRLPALRWQESLVYTGTHVDLGDDRERRDCRRRVVLADDAENPTNYTPFS